MNNNYTFRNWLKDKFLNAEWKKTIVKFVTFPFWELMLGILVCIFSVIWLFGTIWYVAIPLFASQMIFGVLLILHSDYRETYTYNY